jgi:hypothetical protein
MDRDEPMTEPHGDFVGRVCSVFDPVARIVDSLTHVDGNTVGIDSNVAGSLSVLTRPAPDIAEHPPVQFDQELRIEDVAPAQICPAQCHSDIDLFSFVEFVRQRNKDGMSCSRSSKLSGVFASSPKSESRSGMRIRLFIPEPS